EVDEKVIPQNGRDVQCSACGHTWYQYPLEVALQMRAAEDDDDDDDDDPANPPPPPPGDGTGRAKPPRIDKTVLDVLRAEADREMSERARTRGDLETQGDLGLARPTRATPAQARARSEDTLVAPPPPADTPLAAPAGATAGGGDPIRRRNLLPDIEELTSTLEPGSETRRSAETDPDADATPDARGFRNGLSVVLLVAMFLVAIYMLAP
ncbi:MAG: hypothetical protein KJZ59_08780, partial [Pararhodobacter sp.]|nr:hypothetical protein [Pararhodobacter sp.]